MSPEGPFVATEEQTDPGNHAGDPVNRSSDGGDAHVTDAPDAVAGSRRPDGREPSRDAIAAGNDGAPSRPGAEFDEAVVDPSERSTRPETSNAGATSNAESTAVMAQAPESSTGSPDTAPAMPYPGAEPEGAMPRHRQASGGGLRRARRGDRRGRRVNERLWSINPWSTFKVSSLFFLCMALIVLVAGTLLWTIGRSTGTIEQAESFITRLGAYGTCTPEGEVPKGTDFERDDDCPEGSVLLDGFKVDDGALFKAGLLGGGLFVVAGSLGSVLVALLINLLSEITGGIRYSVIREPTPGPAGRAGPANRQLARSAPPPDGRLARPPRGYSSVG